MSYKKASVERQMLFISEVHRKRDFLGVLIQSIYKIIDNFQVSDIIELKMTMIYIIYAIYLLHIH